MKKVIGLEKDKVEVASFNPLWKKEFEKEKKILKSILKQNFKITHIGSTSVLGLSAKPIIDIALAVKTKEQIEETSKILEQNGYEIQQFNTERQDTLAKKGTQINRTHYIHICMESSNEYKNYVLFKNFLLLNPKYIKKYEKLKMRLAKKYKDNRKKYTVKKAKFIKNILKKARKNA